MSRRRGQRSGRIESLPPGRHVRVPSVRGALSEHPPPGRLSVPVLVPTPARSCHASQPGRQWRCCETGQLAAGLVITTVIPRFSAKVEDGLERVAGSGDGVGQLWPVPGGAAAGGAYDEVGDQRCPARLVGGADATAGVAVEILVERQQVVPVRVGLEEVDVAEDRAATVLVVEEDRNETSGEVVGQDCQGYLAPGADGV